MDFYTSLPMQIWHAWMYLKVILCTTVAVPSMYLCVMGAYWKLNRTRLKRRSAHFTRPITIYLSLPMPLRYMSFQIRISSISARFEASEVK